MAQNITLMGASYSAVPAVQLPKTGGGTATFTDVTDTTAAQEDVASGKYFYNASGVRQQGTASGGSSVTVEPFTVSASGTFTAPTGTAYSPINVTKGYANPPASISSSGATGGNNGTNVVVTKTVSVTPSVNAGWITSGTAGNVDITLQASDANFIAGNIRSGISIFGLVGTFTGGGGIGTLLKTESLGAISTSSTTATDISHNVAVTGIYDYDLLIVETSVDTKTNGRHAATTRLIFLTADSSIGTKNGSAIATATWNCKLSSNGTATARSNTTARGIYPYSCTITTTSNGTATLVMFRCYNSTQTGTINGSYTTRVYGVKLYDMIGG